MKKQKSVWIEQLSQWDAALEGSAIDLDMFDVPFLETRNDISTGAGSGSGPGNEHVEPVEPDKLA